MSDPLEWDCEGCGAHVCAWGQTVRPTSGMCSTCEWLCAFIPDPEEMMRMRVSLKEIGDAQPRCAKLHFRFCPGDCQYVLKHHECWHVQADARARAAAGYFDDSFTERTCDYCSRPYRGPALYCCIAHAEADA